MRSQTHKLIAKSLDYYSSKAPPPPTIIIKLSNMIKQLNEHKDLFEHNATHTILSPNTGRTLKQPLTQRKICTNVECHYQLTGICEWLQKDIGLKEYGWLVQERLDFCSTKIGLANCVFLPQLLLASLNSLCKVSWIAAHDHTSSFVAKMWGLMTKEKVYYKQNERLTTCFTCKYFTISM